MGKNQYIVEVDENNSVKISENIINEQLEDGGICQAEEHDQVFKMPEMCVKCCLPFITLTYSD